jgi:MFS family permease
MALSIILGGFAVDASHPRTVLISGCVLTLIAGFLLAPAMSSGSLLVVCAFLSFCLFAQGLNFGPLSSWLPALFPARVRYTGTSVAFTIAGILGGGFTPLIAEKLASSGGLSLVGFYLSTIGGLSLLALLMLPRAASEKPNA